MILEGVDNFLVKLKLSSFLNSRVIDVEDDDGVREKGIFIPIEINNLFLSTRNTVIAWMFATKKFSCPIDDMTHYLKLKVSKTHVDKLKRLGFEPPYLGGMRKTNIYTGYQMKYKKKEPKRVKIQDYE